MPADWTAFAQDVLKLAVHPRYSFSIWVASVFLLAVPLPDFLRLEQFRNDYGHFIGPICLITFFLWIVEVVLLVASEPIRDYLSHKEILKQIDSLNPGEADLLLHAIEKKCQTVTWRGNTGVVDSLISKRLLERVPVSEPNRFDYDPFTIPRFVWDHIAQNAVTQKFKEIKETKGKPE